ncbi:MAG: hypothetical protein Q9165_004509 [Trypethelium subeluteriae]
MGCCTSKEAEPSDSTPYSNAPCAPIPSNDIPPSQPRPASPNRRSASVNSSLAPATDTGLDSSRTNIIQPPASPSPSPLPHGATHHSATTATADSAPTSASNRPSSPPPSKRNPRRRSLFARTTTTNPSSSQPARSTPHNQQKSSTAATPTTTTTTTTERPNAPLRAPSPVPVSPRKPHIPDALQPARPWRRRVLAQQRAEFFDTQTGGREEVWAVVRFACEAMREAMNSTSDAGSVGMEGGGAGEGMGGGGMGVGLADAQGILDAAGLTCPSGRVRDGVYDAQGNRYVIPNWVVRDPEDIVDDEDGEEEKEKEEVVRVEKGKGRMVEEEEEGGNKIVTVKIRRSDPETNYKVRLGKGQSVGALIQRFREEAQLPADLNIRIFFLGKQMSEAKSLAAQTENRWRDGDVVIAFVSQR